MAYNLSDFFPLYVINEYPKSGGTWVGQLLEKAIEVPFPRNQFPLFRESILHGHYLNAEKMKNAIIVWRDGRDVMISWYYHCLFVHEYGNERLVKLTRRALNFESWMDIKSNLPLFIEYAFTRQPNPNFSWTDFVESWSKRNDVIHVFYESLHKSAENELKRIVFQLTRKKISNEKAKQICESLSFNRQVEKQKVKQNSFLRKGIVGDWHNHFTHEARQIFDHYAGDALVKLGYEANHDWVKKP